MGNKKNKNKQKRQLKKIKTKSKPGQIKLLKKLENSGKNVVIEPTGAVRMSDVLQDFAKPLLIESITDSEIKDAVKFSILVWNASLVPSPKKKEVIETFIKQLSTPENIESVKSYIDMLLKRKKDKFLNINRAIVDCQFSGSGKNLRFDVASNL